jgi:hypothetical protein
LAVVDGLPVGEEFNPCVDELCIESNFDCGIDTVAGESMLNDIVGEKVGANQFRLNHNFDT